MLYCFDSDARTTLPTFIELVMVQEVKKLLLGAMTYVLTVVLAVGRGEALGFTTVVDQSVLILYPPTPAADVTLPLVPATEPPKLS